VSLTTYGGLITSVTNWSTYTDITSDLAADFVYWAHQEINRRLRARVMLSTADLALNAAETVTVPTGYVAMRRLYLDVTPRFSLTPTSPEGVQDVIAEIASQTYPTHVADEGTSLHFGPLYTGSATGKLLYYKEATLMSADSDANAVLLKYPYLYLFGSLEALHTYKEDDDTAQQFGAKFGALIEDINLRDAKDAISGPINVRPSAGGIV
jgi:hypothetical protein